MKTIFPAIGMLCLLFTLGCGAGPGIHGIGSGTGKFSNATLNGSYVYQINGIDFSSGSNLDYHEAGVFTADGNGHITTGIDDATEGNASALGSTTSGTYTIAGDGTGTVTLNGSAFGTISLAVTMINSSKAYLVEEDALNAAGGAELQSTAALAAAPSGTFVFKMHTTSSVQGSTATVGQFTVNAGVFQSGSADVNQAGTFSSPSLTNFTLNAPISNGRGTGSFTLSSGTVSAFMYYIVDGNNLRLLSTDTSSNIGGFGRAEMQTGAPFSVASLAGSYVFSSKGDDNSGLDDVNTIGVFGTSAGNISSGAYDAVQDGVVLSNVAVTGGTYQVASSGRATVTLVSASKTANEVLWLVSPSRAFFVTESDTSNSTDVEDGIASLQSGSFSTSSINGQFAFLMDGFSSSAGVFQDRIGTLTWNGSGALTLNELVNDSGNTTTPGTLTGTYSVAANGRAAGTINGLSVNANDLIVYFISNTEGYTLQEDAGSELIGEISQQ